MLVTNHVLAGTVIGLTIHEPILAIIIALLSHFLMDALPHFGYPGKKGYPEVLKHKLSYIVGFLTLFSTLGLIVYLISNQQWFPLMSGLVASSPDLVGLYNYLVYEKKGDHAGGLLRIFHVQFHRRIQNFERPWGIYIEGLVFTILLSLILTI